MDVLSPQLVWIGSRCYRVNPTADSKKLGGVDVDVSQPMGGYVEDDLYEDDERDANYEIEITDNGKFQTSFHVPSIFISHIIGKQGTTRKRLEAETKTQIKVPKQNVEGNVVVVGSSRQAVTASRQRIEMIVISSRNKQPFTHFLSIPFTTSEIKTNFLNFKESVLVMRQRNYNLDESLFQKPEKLHLTVCTLSLMDNDDRSLAAQLLQECKDNIINPILSQYGPLKLKLEGLEYMNDDPKSVDVLYAKVESEPLQMMVDQIETYFVTNGLVQKKYDHVKMHVTLVNTRYRDNVAMEEDKTRIAFDASKILENFGSFYFGTGDFKEIHLSQRYSTACDGFYEATGMIKI